MTQLPSSVSQLNFSKASKLMCCGELLCTHAAMFCLLLTTAIVSRLLLLAVPPPLGTTASANRLATNANSSHAWGPSRYHAAVKSKPGTSQWKTLGIRQTTHHAVSLSVQTSVQS
jgi:hypothetical protein